MNNLEYLKKYYKGNIDSAIEELNKGVPVQYIVGNVDFYGYIYDINKDVLIPRFETEELVDKTIKYCYQYFNHKINILELGTGSGCIAVTLSQELNSDVTAVDLSSKALEVAKHNALKYNQKIDFIESNMLDKVTGKYDLIISNPPYISRNEEIMDIVRDNEPDMALYADNDGLYYYDVILSHASNYLNEKSIIAFEIGWWQGSKIIDMVHKYLPDSKVSLEKDMENKDRFIFVFNNL